MAGSGLRAAYWTGTPEPLTHFPPLYPLALAFVARVGGTTVETAARALNIAAAPSIVVLMAALAAQVSSGLEASAGLAAAWAAVIGGLTCVTLRVGAIALSEPLFIVLMLASLVALCKGLAGGRVGWLIAAALAASLATLTRYAGIILVGTVFLAALALYPRPPLARLGCVALAGIEGMAASVAWSLHNEAVANSVTDRSLALHLVTVPQLWQMVTTLGHYVVPEELPLPGLIRVLVFGTILVVGTWLAASAYVKSKGPWERLNAAQWALIMFAIGYPVFIALSISIADNGVRFAA